MLMSAKIGLSYHPYCVPPLPVAYTFLMSHVYMEALEPHLIDRVLILYLPIDSSLSANEVYRLNVRAQITTSISNPLPFAVCRGSIWRHSSHTFLYAEGLLSKAQASYGIDLVLAS